MGDSVSHPPAVPPPPPQLSMKELLTSLLDNRTWSVLSQNASLSRPLQVDPHNLWQEWWDPNITVFGTLLVFLVMKVACRHREVSLLRTPAWALAPGPSGCQRAALQGWGPSFMC